MKNEDKGKGNENTSIAMRVLVMTGILVMLCLFSVQSVSAVEVSENVKFQTPGTNTTFIMGSDFNFDTIEVHSSELRLNDAVISVCPSAGSIDFTLFSFSTEYRKWTESCSNPDAIADHTMGGLKLNTPYDVKVNGAIYGQYRSNDSGYVFFTYSGGYSDIVFEMEEAGAPPKFIAHFMTPEGEPYPFDVIISDGTWRKEWKKVTYIETEVPVNATYTYVWQSAGYHTMAQFELNIPPGYIRDVKIYAIDRGTVIPREVIYVAVEEIGANANLSWNWDNTTNTLTGNVYQEEGKFTHIFVWIDDAYLEPPNYVEVSCAGKNTWGACFPPNGWWDTGGCEAMINVDVVFSEITSYEGVIGIRRAEKNDAIIDTAYEKFYCQLWDLDGKLYDMEYTFPQYALSPGYYILQPMSIPEGYAKLKSPIQCSIDKPHLLDYYPPKITELEPFTFGISSEYQYACSSYSNLIHDEGSNTISVEVDTGTEYGLKNYAWCPDWWGYFVLPDTVTVAAARSYDGVVWHDLDELYDYTINHVDGYKIVVVRISPTVERLSLRYVDPWTEINNELDALIEKVNNATMPNIIKRRLVDKLEYAKTLNGQAKIAHEAGNDAAAKKYLGVAKNQVESFESMVKITRRISEADKKEFLRESALIIEKIEKLIESL